MIEFATVARPYAKALFALAEEKGQMECWFENLKQLVWLMQQPQVERFIRRPDLVAKEKAIRLIRLLDDVVQDTEFKNFIHVVVGEGRLAVLPDIFRQYEELLLLSKKSKQAMIYTAYDIATEEEKKVIIRDLEQHFQAALQATFVTDPGLIGGIKVVVGDKILDLSVQAKLQQLYTTLTN